jgi:tetratricopeptide (TPR) repeat protein
VYVRPPTDVRSRLSIALGLLALPLWWAAATLLDARAPEREPAPEAAAGRASSGFVPAAMAGGECDATVQRALELVRDAEKTGNVASAQKAVELLLAAEKACPDEHEIAFWRGIAQVFARNHDGSREALGRVRHILADRAAHQNRPAATVNGDPHVLFLEAAIHHYLGTRPDLALEKLTQLKARDPRFMPDRVSLIKYAAHLAWGSLLVRRNELGEAVKQTKLGVHEAQQQMRFAPGNPGAVQRRDMANRNLAEIYRLSDRWVESQQVYEELGKLYPKDGVIHYGLASVYADQYLFSRAVEAWKIAVALIDNGSVTDSRDLVTVEDAKMRLGISLVMAQKIEEGKKVLLAYSEAHPEDSRVWQYLGRFALEMWENFDEAEKWLNKAHQMDPWCADTLRDLVKLYTINKPDAVKRGDVERNLADPEIAAKRKAEMDRRKRIRADASNGCR